MSRRTRRSSPRRSYRFSQGVQPIPRSCEPVLDRQFALRALSGATPWPRHARSRRLPPSPPCRPDACEAMQSNCVAPTRSLGRSSAPLRSECMHPPCPWQHRYRRQPDRFVSSSTPFLAWYGLEALATVRVEEDTGAVPCSVDRLCRLWAQRAQFRQRAVGENRPLSHSGRFRGHKGAGNAGRPMAPAVRVQEMHTVDHRYPGTPGVSCAMVLTVSFVLSPATNSFLSPSPNG